MDFLIRLFNVSNTSDDKTTSGITWIEAFERIAKIKITDSNLVGAHMSTNPGLSGANNTEYIALITKEQNSFSNWKEILVNKKFIVPYKKAKIQ